MLTAWVMVGKALVAVMVVRPRGLVSGRAPTASLSGARTVSGDLVGQGRG